MGKKRTNTHNNDDSPVRETEATTVLATEETVATTPAKIVETTNAGTDDATAVVTADAGATDSETTTPANTSTADTSDMKAKAQRTVENAVGVAMDVAKATVDQIKTQLGEEKTQKVIDYATKAKAEVVEVVDFAKDAVEDATNKYRTNVNNKITEARTKVNDAVNDVKEAATTRITEAKDKATTRITEVKDKASEKITEAKGKATETVDYVKQVAAEKSEKPLQRASEAAEWLKGDVAVTPLEQSTINFASFVVGTTLTVGSAALGVVGLSAPVTKAVNTVRSRVTAIATSTPVIQSAHTYASGFWPYRLVTRMVSTVDGNVKARLAPTAPTTVAANAETDNQ